MLITFFQKDILFKDFIWSDENDWSLNLDISSFPGKKGINTHLFT